MKRSWALAALLGLLGFVLIATPASVAAPPTNDNFANATAIVAMPFSQSVTISEATTEPGEPLWWFGNSRTVWWSFTPATNAMLRVAITSNDWSPFLSVYRANGAGFADLERLSYTYGVMGYYTFRPEAGQMYYIQSGDDSPYGWTNSVTVSLQEILPPTNDNFADATAFTSVPFSDTPDLTAATVEQGEPMACGYFTQSAWYAFTPTTSGSYGGFGLTGINVYTGTSLVDLTSVACSDWPGLYFWADAGETYYLQYYGGGMGIDTVAPPDPAWGYSPGDPSTFDAVTFSHGFGYWDPTITGYAWDFGDGATATGNGISHQFLADGDYTVSLTVSARGGRTATQTQTVQVRTHDVTVLSLVAPDKGKVGRPGVITVGIGNTRYSESVQVDVYKVTPQGDVLIGTDALAVEVMKPKGTVKFPFSYVFTTDDLALGKVSFKAVATLQDARDSIPGDNVVTSPPTLVLK